MLKDDDMKLKLSSRVGRNSTEPPSRSSPCLSNLAPMLQHDKFITLLDNSHNTNTATKTTKTITSTKTPPSKTPPQPYGIFPPELWLEISKHCPTRTLKSLALTNKSLYAISSDRLLHTVILLAEPIPGTFTPPFTLSPSLANATVIKHPAAFNRVILENRNLRWYTVVKNVFVVFKGHLYVVRRSALPLMCYYITWHYAPRELVKFSWKGWVKRSVVVTLWPVGSWGGGGS